MIIVVAVALIVYPFFPAIKYYLSPTETEQEIIPGESEANSVGYIVNEEPEDVASGSLNNNITQNLLIIPKIGVKIPIVEGATEAALNKGAWRLPETSTPDKGSNTVLTGHRWRYRPPSEKTFYLLDKLEIGDSFRIFWQGKEYNYKIISKIVVLPTDVWVLNGTEKSIVTLITCTPLFSTEKRLVVKGELEYN